jgi:hypothetical protein
MGFFDGLKDELNIGVDAAAREELRQETDKGYNPERSGGSIKRGFFEQARDFLLQNDPEAIQKRAQELYVKDLKANNPGLADLNTRLTAVDQATIDLSPTTTQSQIDTQTSKINRTLPGLEEIDAKGGDRTGLSIDSSQGQILEALDTATTDRANTKYYDSPGYQQYLDTMAQSDKRFNATQQLAISQQGLAQQQAANQMQIAQMNNQLQMRREDARDRSADRKDRQQMIMMLMKGLSNLGGSIAI